MSFRITELKVGHCVHPECMALKGAPWRAREYPARAYLLQSAEGAWLWDTGYAPHFFQQTKGIFRLYSLATPVTLPPEERLLAQLKTHGVEPSALRAVLLSHFHADHVAGVADLPGVPVWASKDAWESLDEVSGMRALLRGQVPGLVPPGVRDRGHQLESLPRIALPSSLAPFDTGWALAPGLVAVSLPGHAKGHMGLFVQEHGTTWNLLASDAAWSQAAFSAPQGLQGPSELSFLIQHDKELYYETLRRLRLLQGRGVRIRLSHEPWRPAGASSS